MNWDEKQSLASRAFTESVSQPSGWSRANCLFCPQLLGKRDKRRALSINSRTGFYRCFRCSTTGRLDFGLPQEEAPPAPDVPVITKPDGFVPLYSDDGMRSLALAPARAFLAHRGVPRGTWELAKIGACAGGEHYGRVIVPVLPAGDSGGKWLGWVGRAWTNAAWQRYLYPPGMPRGTILYNHAALHVETDEPVIVVEGVFDALPHWPNAVAMLGKPSAWQCEELTETDRPIAIAMDGDAWEEGLMLALQLRFAGKRAGSIHFPPKTDPNDVTTAWIMDAARKCIQ